MSHALDGRAVETAVKSRALRKPDEHSAKTTSQNRTPLPRSDGFFAVGCSCTSPASSEARPSSSDGFSDGGALVTTVDAGDAGDSGKGGRSMA